MLTKTSESAIKELIYLAHNPSEEPVPPRRIAERLGLSPSYLAKVTRQLVRANILRAHRGALGGVSLNRPPEVITLLDIVEACQGRLAGDFCTEVDDLRQACAFHQAGAEIHEALVNVLSRWTLSNLMAKRGVAHSAQGNSRCWMRGVHEATGGAHTSGRS